MPNERDIAMLRERMGVVEERVGEVRESLVEHRTRLENGVKVFADQKERLTTVEKRIAPRPPKVYKIVGITLTVVLAGAGALWGLANSLRDRPTIEQIDKIIKSHDSSGHKDVRTEQSKQRTIIESVSKEQKKQGKKLDELLIRTPRRR